jgi:hypothetical protein
MYGFYLHGFVVIRLVFAACSRLRAVPHVFRATLRDGLDYPGSFAGPSTDGPIANWSFVAFVGLGLLALITLWASKSDA